MAGTLDLADLSVWSAATVCGSHPIDLRQDEIVAVVGSWQGCSCEEEGNPACGSYCDSSGVAIYRLRDRTYAVVDESSDTTGHG